MLERPFSLIICVYLLAGCAASAAVLRSSIAEKAATASQQLTVASEASAVLSAQIASTVSKMEDEHTVAPSTMRRLRTALLKRRALRAQVAQQPSSAQSTRSVSALQKKKTDPYAVVDQPDITPQHRALARDLLSRMPARCVSSLQHFYVRYDNPEQRGLAGKATMILSGNVSEFAPLFVHEFGHVSDLGCLTGTRAAGETVFVDGKDMMYADDPSVTFYRISWNESHQRRTDAADADFVSGYASWDAFEDFAETFAYYVFQRENFALRAQENVAIAAKYQWFTENMKDLPQLGTSTEKWNGTVPWDVTKLPYKPLVELAAQ